MPSPSEKKPVKPSTTGTSVASLPSAAQTFDVRATKWYPDVVDNIKEAAGLLKLDQSEFVRQAIKAAYERVKAGMPIEGEADWANAGINSYRGPYLSRIPCGPWAKAVDTKDSYTISADTADEFEAQEGDAFIRAEGASMDGAGIMDNYVVMVRPYEKRAPKRGDIVLVQAFTSEDEGDEEAIVATLKTFEKWEDGLPVLLDGNGDRFPLPEGTKRASLVARSVGVIGSI